MRSAWAGGRRRLQPTGRTAQTNDLGQFRIYGLSPGDYYVSATWHELTHAGAEVVAVAGLARLAYVAWRDEVWLARLVLLWGVAPMVLISLGTSKLLHYAYPFWPPIGIGAGMAFTWMLEKLDEPIGAWCRRAFGRSARLVEWSLRPGSQYVPSLVIVAGLVALAVATLVHGPVVIERGGRCCSGTPQRCARSSSPRSWPARRRLPALARLTGVLVALMLPLGVTPTRWSSSAGSIIHFERRECVAECSRAVRSWRRVRWRRAASSITAITYLRNLGRGPGLSSSRKNRRSSA
jgi:hypothetical protein